MYPKPNLAMLGIACFLIFTSFIDAGSPPPTNPDSSDCQLVTPEHLEDCGEVDHSPEAAGQNDINSQLAWCGAGPLLYPDQSETTIAADNFGNYYSSDMLRIPKPDSSSTNLASGELSTNCGCDDVGITLSLFDLYFEDCIYDSDEGFDDPVEGPDRREALCASLAYLESLIVPNTSICNPGESRRVNIQVLPSDDVDNYPTDLPDIAPNVLGFASPYYTQRSFYVGIRHSWPWEIINSGEYPVPPVNEDFYHARTRFNFLNPAIEWQTEYTATVTGDRYDLYTVALHEFTHAIGFASAFNNTIGELGSRFGLGRYNNFDQHIQIKYANQAEIDLIKNGTPANSFPFAHEWFFNDNVDGVSDPSDLHSSCPGPGPHLTFNGAVANHPLYTGDEFEQGSSFSHFDGNCIPAGGTFIDFVMHPNIDRNIDRRLFQWQELDALRTMGYNIDCTSADFVDANPSDQFTFDCSFDDEDCAIASVSDTRENLEDCGLPTVLLTIGTCPGENIEPISVLTLENLLSANDHGTMGIAFIQPLFGEAMGTFEKVGNNYILTTQSWGNFTFTYAPVRCNGAIGNVSIFSITTFPGENCGDLVSCEFLTCEDFDIPLEWECILFEQCEASFCNEPNLICNGGFCGTIASEEEIVFPPFFAHPFGQSPHAPFNDLDPSLSVLVSPYSWIKGSGTPDYVIPGTLEGLPGMAFSSDATGMEEYNESVYTYLTNTPEVGETYLFSADFSKFFSSDPDEVGIAARLIQGQSYEPCNLGSIPNQYCYDPNSPDQTIYDPNGMTYSEEGRFRAVNCFTVLDNFNAFVIETINVGVGQYTVIDNIELLPDNFSAGDDLTSEICNQPQTLGGEPFCMLSDVGVEYNWHELDEAGNIIEPALLTYTQADIIAGNPTTLSVSPAMTTTYRLIREITDLADLPADFELCMLEDEVTINVLTPLPLADFMADAVAGECGVYNFTSSDESPGFTHAWYFNEVIEDNLFSMEISPTAVQLPNGTVTIIHVVQNDCGVEQFEQVIEVDCEVPFTCACEGPMALNIDAGDGTLLSNLITDGEMPANGISNRCLAISGELRIDPDIPGEAYFINNSEVRMQPGARIVIEPKASLTLEDNNTNGGIHGCEALWQGFVLEPGTTATPTPDGGEINLVNTTISDAVYAIEPAHNTTLKMVDCNLDRNHIGIYLAPSNIWPGAQVVYQPTFIQNSQFGASSSLLPPYDGQIVTTTATSFAGIEINDCKFFFIGGGNIDGAEISRSNYGVISRNSQISLRNSRIFKLIENSTDFFSSTGILLEGVESNPVISRNRLHDMRYGIYVDNSPLDASGNRIGEDLNGNTGNKMKRGIFGNLPFAASIDIYGGNFIYAQQYGIQFSQAHLANFVDISDNTVELVQPDAGVLNFDAIRLGDALMSGDNDRITVTDNIINLHNDGYGISLYNVNGTTIRDNTINFKASYDAFPVSKFGLLFHQASNNIVYANTVEDEGTTSSTGGIYVLEGDMNKLCCNTTLNTYIGAQFFGDCHATDLRHTIFDGNHIGLECKENTLIGEQNATGNQWFNNGFLKGRHLSLDPDDVVGSRFRASPSQGPEFLPIPSELFVTSNVQWFFDGVVSSNCANDVGCNINSLEELAKDSSFIQKLINSGFNYGDYPATSAWEAAWPFYRSQIATAVQDQSDWTATGQAFYGQQMQSNSILHQIISDARSLEEELSYNPSIGAAADSLDFVTEQLYQLDLTLVAGQNPTATYLADRATLLGRYETYLASYRSLVSAKESDYQILINQLLQANNSINAIEDAATALVQVNGYYLEILAGQLNELSTTMESGLTTIAESCPQRYGSAVARAQSILLQFDKGFTATTNCNAAKSLKTKTPIVDDELTAKSSSLNNFRIYPNPATGVIYLQLPADINNPETYTLELFDAAGRLHHSGLITGSISQVNTSNLPSGVYWIRLRSVTRAVSKRVIIK